MQSQHSKYSILIPEETLARAADYLGALQEKGTQLGVRLRHSLSSSDLNLMTPLDLLGALLDTKQPQIFAEMTVVGDGSDWNLTELGLLGDVSIAVPVSIFDNGHHTAPIAHTPAFSGTLVFTPGALLRNGQGQPPADWAEVTQPNGQISREGYYSLYRRRLLPVLRYINEQAAQPRSALLTIPGLGCGQFAGPFRGQLGLELQAVLERLLTEYAAALPNLRAVYFDPYSECHPTESDIHGIAYRVRPFKQLGAQGKPQLCQPVDYEEPDDDFSGCTLYSIVAWDHVSWPGNDFFIGARATDDGVKAAATSSMAALTGLEGRYDPKLGQYQPPQPYRTWGEVVQARGLRLWDTKAMGCPAR